LRRSYKALSTPASAAARSSLTTGTRPPKRRRTSEFVLYSAVMAKVPAA